MKYGRIKLAFTAIALAVSFMAFGSIAYAENIDQGTETAFVGSSVSKTTSNLKINGKPYKKSKSKVKTIVVEKMPQDIVYNTKDYYDTYEAYESENAYEAEHGYEAFKFFPKETTYTMIFKKAGTYKISTEVYVSDSYDHEYYDYDDENDVYIYTISKYNIVDQEWEEITQAYEIYGYDEYNYMDESEISPTVTIAGKTYTRAVENYFAGFDGSIYAYGREFVPAKVNKAADGKYHVRYSANKPRKVNFITTYKVLPTDGVFKSVKLGKVSQTYNEKEKIGGFSYKATRGKFLTGNSGKLVVTMADKNYKLGGVIVRTVDEKSNYVFAHSGNKKTITYGNNLYNKFSDYKFDDGTATGYSKLDPFKITRLYLPYTDSAANRGTTVSGTGNTYVINNYHMDKIKGKKYKHTSTYTVNVEKETFDDGSYDYYFKVTYVNDHPYYDSASKTVKYEKNTEEYTAYDLDMGNFMENFHVYEFYKN